MNGGIRLMGMRFRGEEFARVGDRLRFGESSESMACMLAFLDAEVRSIDGEQAVLAFAFSGPALDEALQRLGRNT